MSTHIFFIVANYRSFSLSELTIGVACHDMVSDGWECA